MQIAPGECGSAIPLCWAWHLVVPKVTWLLPWGEFGTQIGLWIAAALSGWFMAASAVAFAMGIPHQSAECPPCAHWGTISRLSFPCLSKPGRLLPCFGTQTHTLLEAQIKGSTPLPASQWTLCAEGSQRELGSKETGRGGGALHKDTCHSEKPSEDGVKKAPGGGRVACC